MPYTGDMNKIDLCGKRLIGILNNMFLGVDYTLKDIMVDCITYQHCTISINGEMLVLCYNSHPIWGVMGRIHMFGDAFEKESNAVSIDARTFVFYLKQKGNL